ncbi:hypothetical protein H6G17_31335 [Chroococcidiopsis sp. FACHB-1243]|uniref:hypothetical protein n=1 Tax=Chroococcidiopsis sp. [FACHB-1243] TaxID=2692781 RepID=UPI00177C993B|nr:hypothetical protein [Chroococcidiopsis sp. [FACHB-1243]]MBD2309903.1 hypothetical protein [Chroococcidiopsis sp. [FACHB-1243]]
MNYNSTPLAVVSERELVATESFFGDDSNRFAPEEAVLGEILAPLSPEEQRDRHLLELKVRQGFYQTGKALAQIRDRWLYRSTHRTFEAYSQDRFGFSRRCSDYLIAAACVIENLQQMRTIHSQERSNEPERLNQNNVSTLQAQILPTKLEQVKPLTSIKTAQEQWQVWNQAIEAANGKVPSGRIVNEIVAQLKQKPLVLAPDDWHVGDVFTLVGLEGKERKYNGCSCIATELTDSTVTIEVHDATLSVKLENLNEIASSDDKRQLPQTLRRVRRLRAVESLDRGAVNVLKDLSKRTNLTPVEEGLLSWIENYYRVTE